MRAWRRLGPLLALVLVLTPLLALAPVSLPPDGGVWEAEAAPDLKLPWDKAENGQWTMTQGPHSPLTGGPTSGLDFARGYENPSPVLSMFKGHVSNVGYLDQAYCGNPGNSVVEITSDDGTWKVQYLHITDFGHIKNGQPIQQGDYIGKTGRVGCAGGVHVHLELFINGSRSSWAGRTIDGWQVASSTKPNSSNATGPSCPARPLKVTTALTVVPGDPRVGDRVDASFVVTNTAGEGCPALTLKRIGAGGRGPGGDPDVQDFRIDENVTIGPQRVFEYSANRSFGTVGQHRFVVSAQDTSGAWYTVDSSNTVTIQVQAPLPTPTPIPMSTPPPSAATSAPPAPPAPTETAVATETSAPESPPAVETAAPESPTAVETTAPEPPDDEDDDGGPVGIERCVIDPEAVPLLRALDPTPDGLITTDELRGLAATMGSAELQALADQAVAEGTPGYRYEGVCNADGGDVNVPAESPVETPPPEPEDALAAAVRAAVPTSASANDGTVDRDGVVCLVLEEGVAAVVASVDANGDGTITLAEARAVAPNNVELQQAVDLAASRGITGFHYQGCGAPAVAVTVTATVAASAPAAAPVPGAPPSSAEEVAMISGSDGDAVNCRAAASVESDVIARLPEGTVVDLNGPAVGGWQPVICDGKPGYVATAFLATASPQVSSAATPTGEDPELIAIQPVDGSAPVDATETAAPDGGSAETPVDASSAPAAAPAGTEAAQVVSGEQSTEEPNVATTAQPEPLAVAGVTDSEQSSGAASAIDGDPATSWSVVPQLSPRQVELTLDLGQPQPVGRMELELANGATLPPAEVWLSIDGATWWNVTSFDTAVATPAPDGAHSIPLGYTARFVRLVVPTVDVAGLPEIGGIVEVIIWPAEGEVTTLETLGAPVTPVPVSTETQTPPIGDESPVAAPPTAAAGEVVPTDEPPSETSESGTGDDPPQVIEAEPAG